MTGEQPHWDSDPNMCASAGIATQIALAEVLGWGPYRTSLSSIQGVLGARGSRNVSAPVLCHSTAAAPT